MRTTDSHQQGFELSFEILLLVPKAKTLSLFRVLGSIRGKSTESFVGVCLFSVTCSNSRDRPHDSDLMFFCYFSFELNLRDEMQWPGQFLYSNNEDHISGFQETFNEFKSKAF